MPNSLTEKQTAARLKAAQDYLQKRFPGRAFILLVAESGAPGTKNVQAAFNVHPPLMRTLLRKFADYHEAAERAPQGGVQ